MWKGGSNTSGLTMHHPKPETARNIEEHRGIIDVGRSLYLNAQYAIVVNSDEKIDIICKLKEQFNLKLLTVVCDDKRTAIHCSKHG